MKVAGLIRNFFYNAGETRKEKGRAVRNLSLRDSRQELGSLLHDACVRGAAGFVKDELDKNDSPFKGVPAPKLFQEMMILNYWILDMKAAKNKRAIFLEEIYNRHFELYGVTLDREKELASMQERHRAYYDSWDEVTGHQDKFGMKISEFIFGKKGDIPRIAEVSFWIISYAHSTMKTFGGMLKKFPAN